MAAYVVNIAESAGDDPTTIAQDIELALLEEGFDVISVNPWGSDVNPNTSLPTPEDIGLSSSGFA